MEVKKQWRPGDVFFGGIDPSFTECGLVLEVVVPKFPCIAIPWVRILVFRDNNNQFEGFPESGFYQMSTISQRAIRVEEISLRDQAQEMRVPK